MGKGNFSVSLSPDFEETQPILAGSTSPPEKMREGRFGIGLS